VAALRVGPVNRYVCCAFPRPALCFSIVRFVAPANTPSTMAVCRTCSFGALARDDASAVDGGPAGVSPVVTGPVVASALHGGFEGGSVSAPWNTFRRDMFERVVSEADLRRWDMAATKPLSEPQRVAMGAPPGSFRFMQSRYVPAGTAHQGVGAGTHHWIRATSPLEWATLGIGATGFLGTLSYAIWAQVTGA